MFGLRYGCASSAGRGVDERGARRASALSALAPLRLAARADTAPQTRYVRVVYITACACAQHFRTVETLRCACSGKLHVYTSLILLARICIQPQLVSAFTSCRAGDDASDDDSQVPTVVFVSKLFAVERRHLPRHKARSLTANTSAKC